MGFTFSHPALILPFRYLPRKFYSFTGLVVGSMVPDLEYFIRLDNRSMFSHSYAGLLVFNLPMGILVAILYHQLLRENLINNLPRFLYIRLERFSRIHWMEYFKKNWFIVSLSILAGAITHLAWDSFTSYNGYFVKNFSFFKLKHSLFPGIEFYTYKIVKHVSSLIGVLFLLYFLFRLPLNREAGYHYKSGKYWSFMFILFVFGVILQLLLPIKYITINLFIKKLISSALFALLLTSAGFRYFPKYLK